MNAAVPRSSSSGPIAYGMASGRGHLVESHTRSCASSEAVNWRAYWNAHLPCLPSGRTRRRTCSTDNPRSLEPTLSVNALLQDHLPGWCGDETEACAGVHRDAGPQAGRRTVCSWHRASSTSFPAPQSTTRNWPGAAVSERGDPLAVRVHIRKGNAKQDVGGAVTRVVVAMIIFVPKGIALWH
jgi:hypothetical protein